MDELVSPLDRHVVHVARSHLPWLSSTYFTRMRRRKVIKRSPEPDGGRHTIHNNYNARTHNGKCGQQAIKYDPPLYTTYIRNGTCTKYGAFPWTVQIQVGKKAPTTTITLNISYQPLNGRLTALSTFGLRLTPFHIIGTGHNGLYSFRLGAIPSMSIDVEVL